MRVLHILAELKPSGAEMMFHAAAGLWRSHGMELHILCTGDRLGPVAPRLQADGYILHHLPFSRSAAHVFAVYRLLVAKGFDVVHINTERASFWYAAAARLAGTGRVLRTIHNVFPFRGMLRLRRAAQRWLQRQIKVTMISISPSVCSTEWERFRNPTELIANWFAEDIYRPPTCEERARARMVLALTDGELVVTSVGGCWSYKNHAAILHALADLPKHTRVIYFHVGMEDPGQPERLLAHELGIMHRVRFCGVLPDILPVLHASDVFLMPSLYEGFGCAAIEAMAAGLPAVLSRVSGLRDFAAVCPEICWIDTTPEAIAGAILRFQQMQPGQRREIGLTLSSAVHRHFGVANGAARYLELYSAAYVPAGKGLIHRPSLTNSRIG